MFVIYYAQSSTLGAYNTSLSTVFYTCEPLLNVFVFLQEYKLELMTSIHAKFQMEMTNPMTSKKKKGAN